MERIIAGRFKTTDEARFAASLMAQYIDASDICVFYNSSPSQQEASASVGEAHEDSGAEGSGKSAGITAIIGGVAAGAICALGGPLVAIPAAGVGAYAGSLVGALAGLGNDDKAHAPEHRQAGIMLSIRIASPEIQEKVVATLRAEGAADIEQAEGEWRDGEWADFDPVATPKLVRSSLN
jgi:hypothetical protein